MQTDIPDQGMQDAMETISEPRTTTEKDEAPMLPELDFPNGGFMAWLQVVGSFFIFFNTW